MGVFSVVWLVVSTGAAFVGYFFYTNMPKQGSFFFKIGYSLYTNTRLGYLYYRREVKKARIKHSNEGHSAAEPTVFSGLQILPIPMSQDNYSYLVTDLKTKVSVLIDPAEPEAVQPKLDEDDISPVAILTTHKHWDHSAGNREFRRRHRHIRVYGGEHDNVPGATDSVQDGQVLEFGLLKFTVYHTPGHTVGHVVYILDGAPFGSPPCLFSGDHLFLGGIGRMFECTAEQMMQSLDRLADLHADTLVWPGHEYAKDNLEFATHLLPDCMAISNKLQWTNEQRDNRKCTCPSTLAEEKTYNPFLRVHEGPVQEALGLAELNDLSADQLRTRALHECRTRKDNFKYKL